MTVLFWDEARRGCDNFACATIIFSFLFSNGFEEPVIK